MRRWLPIDSPVTTAQPDDVSFGKRFASAVVVLCLFLAGLAASSPDLHSGLHGGGECEAPACAAVMFGDGAVLIPAEGALQVELRERPSVFRIARRGERDRSDLLEALPDGRAPPVVHLLFG